MSKVNRAVRLGTVGVAVAFGLTTSAYAAPSVLAANAPVTTVESGCTEFAYIRGGLESKVRPLVPERFTLTPFPAPPDFPARVELRINEVVCDVATTTTPRRQERQRKVTTLIFSVNTDTIDGQPSDGFYVLLYATENRLQHAAFNALGWSVDRLKRSSGLGTVSTTAGGLTQVRLTVAGSGWDHVLDAATIFPPGEPQTSQGTFYRDAGGQRLKFCFRNESNSVVGAVTGDLTTTPFPTIAAARPTYAGWDAEYLTGGWTSTLTPGDCPSG